MNEIEVRQERCEKGSVDVGKRAHPVVTCTPAIAEFCDCQVYKTGALIHFFGLPHDVEIARFMLDLCRAAMDGEWATYRKILKAAGKRATPKLRSDFMAAMRSRLSARILEMKQARAQPMPGDGRSIMLVKNAVVAEQFAELGLKLKKGRRARVRYRDPDAVTAGIAAGDRP